MATDLPKVETSGKAGRPSGPGGINEEGALDRAIRQVTARLCRDFADYQARDPAGFRRRVVSLVRAGLRTRKAPSTPG